jgi:hypothetical protein
LNEENEEEVMVMEGVPVEGREKREADENIAFHITDVISTFPLPPKEMRATEKGFEEEGEVSLIVKVDSLIVPVVVTEKRGEFNSEEFEELCWRFTDDKVNSPEDTRKRAFPFSLHTIVGTVVLAEMSISLSSIFTCPSVNVPG